MTAPDLPTWTVADDHEGEPTLWYGGTAVLRKLDLFRFIGGKNDRAKQAFAFHLWEALTAIHAPDEATVERLARALVEDSWPVPRRVTARQHVEAVLAALPGTSAQARQPTQESGMHEHMRDAAGYCQTCDAGPRSASADPHPPEQSMLEHAAELVISTQFGSVSFLKRKLDIGYTVANELMNRLDELGVVGPQVGSKARDVLVLPHQLPDVLERIKAQARHTDDDDATGGA